MNATKHSFFKKPTHMNSHKRYRAVTKMRHILYLEPPKRRYSS